MPTQILHSLLHAPDGVLYQAQTAGLHLLVQKQGSQIALFFQNQDGSLDGPMSRLDLTRPLYLLAEYSQALLLALLWQPEPVRVALVGYGGGRLTLVLAEALPNTTLVSIDIDPLFFWIGQHYFGVPTQERLIEQVGDGRALLARTGSAYDIILLDAFSDQQSNLNHLATTEFYQICAERLTPEGIVATNLLRSDALLERKAAAFATSFNQTWVVAMKHSLVFYGSSRTRFPLTQAIPRATILAERLGFAFPFAEHAANLRPYRPADLGLARTAPLTDGPGD